MILRILLPFTLLTVLCCSVAAQPQRQTPGRVSDPAPGPARVEVVRLPVTSSSARVEAERIFGSLCQDYARLRSFAQANPAARSLPAFDTLQRICPTVERRAELQKYSCKNTKVPDLSTSGECADTTTEAVTRSIAMCTDVKAACTGTNWQYSASK